jgi:hypothetical protein
MLPSVARGIYSALGHWPEESLAGLCETLRSVGRALEDDGARDGELEAWPAPVRVAVAEAVAAIRAFEARVGESCGVDAEIVTTPSGRAIELGNRGHVAFGAEHEDAAATVARSLAALLDALGATSSSWFTMD